MRSLREALAGAPTAVLAAALAVIVIGAGLFGFAIAELTGGDGDGGSASAPSGQAPAVVGGATQGSAPKGGSAVPSWPKGLIAHTVVIARSTDNAAALGAAREARRVGLDAGIMAAERYGLGPKGLWLVFTGHFAARAGARHYAKRLAVRYPGARVELVQSSQ
jgi:hypothetical protein